MASLRILALALVASAFSSAVAQQTVIGIIGDWGFGPGGIPAGGQDTNYAYQKYVAAALGARCAIVGCNLVLGTGDNFYDSGISSVLGVTDPQWNTSVNGVYTHPSLANIPFYHSLGNHDYGYGSPDQFIPYTDGDASYPVSHFNQSIWPQVEFTWADPTQRWKMPGRFYALQVNDGPIPFGLTVMDSSPYLYAYCCDSTSSVKNGTEGVDQWTTPSGVNSLFTGANCSSTYNTSELLYACQNNQRDAQAAWATRSLQNFNSKGLWNIFIGHHPMINIGDGMQPPWSFFLPQIMNAPGAKPHMAFNGHEHVLTVEHNNLVTQTLFSTIGSSGNVQSALKNSSTSLYAQSGYYTPCPDIPAKTTVNYPTSCTWQFQAAQSGFAIVTLNATHAILNYYGAVKPTASSTFNLLYSTTFAKF